MSGHHSARSSNAKLVVLVAAIAVVVIALAFLGVRFFLSENQPSAYIAPEVSADISVQDANGRNVSSNVAVTAGTIRPDETMVAADADLMLLDIGWTHKKPMAAPAILTISDSSFPNGDGLAVYHYNNDQWTLIGTYLIANNAVSFQIDSFSPFAFQVISAQPQTTPEPVIEVTPEPTPEPTPEATPEPTPEPIDYGTYSEALEGRYIQADKIVSDGKYIIGLLEPAEVTEDGDVVFFGDETDDEGNAVANASVLLNYDGETLRTVSVQVAKASDGTYYITEGLVEGMIFEAVEADPYGGTNRYSLQSQDKYLNVDDANENVILNDDDYRTRWLYEDVDDMETLTYRVSSTAYYGKTFSMTESEDGSESLEFTVTSDSDEALEFILFRYDDGKEQVETDVVSGTLVLTSTPAADQNLEATPVPTKEPESDGPTPVTPTPVPPTATPDSGDEGTDDESTGDEGTDNEGTGGEGTGGESSGGESSGGSDASGTDIDTSDTDAPASGTDAGGST